MNILSALAALALANVAAAATCNADNCARAVTGTFRQLTATHYGDCASFLACTMTPAPVTVTAASTVTVTSTGAVITATGSSFDESGLIKRVAVTSAVGSVVNCPSSVPSYASACSGTVRYSSACSCYGATQRTVTTTAPTSTVIPTVTTSIPASVVTVPLSPPSVCGNEGLQWAYYRDYQPDYDEEQSVAYDPTVIKTYTPLLTGVTDYLSVDTKDDSNNGNGYIYGGNLESNDFYTLEHRGYIFAPESGTYSFAVSNVDNNWFLWIGNAAYSGWTKDNAQQDNIHLDLTNGYYGQPGGSGTYTMDLVAGIYYPVRMIFHNDRGPASFDFTITAPSGYKLISYDPNQAKYNPFIVQYSCDRLLAPPFQPYGQET